MTHGPVETASEVVEPGDWQTDWHGNDVHAAEAAQELTSQLTTPKRPNGRGSTSPKNQAASGATRQPAGRSGAVAGAGAPAPTGPAKPSAPAVPASVHDLTAHRARSTADPKSEPRRRWREPFNWVARVQPVARLATDVLAITAAHVLLTQYLIGRFSPGLLFLVFLPTLALWRLYSPTQGIHVGSLVADLPRLIAGCAVAGLVVRVLLAQHTDLRTTTLVAVTVLLCLVLARGAQYIFASSLRRHGFGVSRTLIVGHGSTVPKLVAKISKHPEYGLEVVGVMQDEGRDADSDDAAIGARPEDLPEIVTRLGVQQLVLVPGDDDSRFVSDCFLAVDGLEVQASLVPPLHDFLLSPAEVEQIEGIPMISLGRLSYAPRMMPGKRTMDLLGAGLMIAFLSPVLAAIALCIKLEDRKGPVFFRQRRAGHRGRYFQMIKFRSMCVDAEKRLADLHAMNETDGLLFKIKDDPRVTRIGAFIRRTSLDELPQLFNVIKGEMSLVGPRALPVEVEHFGDIAIKRLNVRPGCTGFWQILGRSDLGYDEMVKLDLAYIQNWSLWVDIQLILKTIPVICGRKGAY